MKPLVSIVIPVYNGSNYLKEAIDSALGQTYNNCEIIVVDDGSTDDTEQICLSYSESIRYFHKKNGGVSTALNLGIENMSGEYFSWLSHDDLYHPDKIQRQIDALLSNPSKSIVIGNFHIVRMDNGKKTLYNLENLFECDPNKMTRGIYPVLFEHINACAMLIRKERIYEVGVLDENLYTAQDVEWIFRLLRGQTPVYVAEPLVTVRQHIEQGSHHIKTYYEEQTETRIKLLNRVSYQEINDLFGSKYMFYYQMATHYKHSNQDSFKYAKTQLESLKTEYVDIEDSISKLRERLSALSNSYATKICIFGAGDWGRSVLYEFKMREIEIYCFSDNNSNLWGKFVDDVKIIDPKTINKDSTLIIIAMKQGEEVLPDMLNNGYKYVVTWQYIRASVRSTLLRHIPN